MSIIGWIILGLIAGFIASKIVNKQGGGIVLVIFLGVVGAIAGFPVLPCRRRRRRGRGAPGIPRDFRP